jgi:hypothetical protein
MPKVKISEFDIDPANNTDINSINIAEGCAPSGINNAIRQLMSDLKEFQTGAGGDPFNGAVNGTVGATTANTGAFTTLSASGVTTVSAGSVSAPAITTSGDTNTGIFFPAADTIAFTEGGTESMRIDSSGNVGIGTTSTSSTYILRLNSANSNIGFMVSGTQAFTVGALSGGGGAFYYGTGNVEAMRIDSSGKLLTNGASNTYGAAGSLSLNGGSGSATDVELRVGNTLYSYLYTSGADVQLASVTSIPLRFLTNDTERMRIDSSGNLLVGTTSAGIANTLSTTIETSGANNSRITVNHSSVAGSSNDSNYMQFGYGGNLIGRIVQASTTTVSYTTSSDYRLKENIEPMTGALAKVALLKPVTYRWKSNQQDTQGFIAHELQEVIPECVVGEKDAVDEEGNPQYQGIDTSFLVATLTAAIQELKAELDTVKSELQALKG